MKTMKTRKTRVKVKAKARVKVHEYASAKNN